MKATPREENSPKNKACPHLGVSLSRRTHKKKNNKYSTKLFEIGVEDGLGGRF